MSEDDVLERHTFVPMFATALLGVALAVGAAWSFEHVWCVPALGKSAVGVCAAIRLNPPWIPLASLASAPSLLLTWYWRTKHKKTELAQKDREHSLKEEEQIREKANVDRQQLINLRVDVVQALDGLDSRRHVETSKRLHVIQSACSRTELVDTIIAGLTHFLKVPYDDSGFVEVVQSQGKRNREQALRMLAEMSRANNRSIDLHGAHLQDLDLPFDLSRFDLTYASLARSRLHNANLVGATMTHVRASAALYDESTQMNDEATLALGLGGARFLKLGPGPASSEILDGLRKLGVVGAAGQSEPTAVATKQEDEEEG